VHAEVSSTHSVPDPVVKDHREGRQLIGLRHKVARGRITEHVAAIAERRNDQFIRSGELGPDRRPEPPTEATGSVAAKNRARLLEIDLCGYQVVLIDDNAVVAFDLVDAV